MKLTHLVTLPALALAIASPALAQRPAPALVGIYVQAQGGALLNPRTTPTFGVEFGDHVGRDVVAFATLSYFDDIMDDALVNDLARLSRTLTSGTGRVFNLQGRDRGVSFVAGAKYHVGRGPVKPYVGGGAGTLAIRRRITDSRAGDVTAATLAEFGIGDPALTINSATRPLAEGAAGVDLDFGRTHVDVGYRYRRAFQFSQPPDLSQVAIGLGINF